jgi:cysteine desulfurase
MRDHFEQIILKKIAGARINGSLQYRLPNTSSITIPGLNAARAVEELGEQGLCISAGSACTSGSGTASHVLTAMGLSENDARATLRFSWCADNTLEETDRAIEMVANYVAARCRNAHAAPAIA